MTAHHLLVPHETFVQVVAHAAPLRFSNASVELMRVAVGSRVSIEDKANPLQAPVLLRVTSMQRTLDGLGWFALVESEPVNEATGVGGTVRVGSDLQAANTPHTTAQAPAWPPLVSIGDDRPGWAEESRGISPETWAALKPGRHERGYVHALDDNTRQRRAFQPVYTDHPLGCDPSMHDALRKLERSTQPPLAHVEPQADGSLKVTPWAQPVAIVREQLDGNRAIVEWLFNPVPEGEELSWPNQP